MPSNLKFYPLSAVENGYAYAAPKGGAIVKSFVYDPEYQKSNLDATMPRLGILVDEAVGATAVATLAFWVAKVPYSNGVATLPDPSLSKALSYVGRADPFVNHFKSSLENPGGWYAAYQSIAA